MSRVFKLAVFSAAVLLSQSEASSQTQLVCQTPAFWCGIIGPGPFGNAPCWCNSPMGPISGYTIVPQVAGNPGGGNPGGGNPSGGGNPGGGNPGGGNDPEDCLDGLGNCVGTFDLND